MINSFQQYAALENLDMKLVKTKGSTYGTYQVLYKFKEKQSVHTGFILSSNNNMT